MRATRGEIYTAVVYSRIENTLEYEKEPSFSFKCRVASENEKNMFEPLPGLVVESEGILLYATNIPHEIKPQDRVVYLGKEYLVNQIGYFIAKNRVVNGDIFSPRKIHEISPKGIRLS